MKLLHPTFVVLSMLLTRMILAAPPTTAPMDRDAAMDPCTEHLKTIGNALAAYEHDNGKLPDQLSDLFPKYVAEASQFVPSCRCRLRFHCCV